MLRHSNRTNLFGAHRSPKVVKQTTLFAFDWPCKIVVAIGKGPSTEMSQLDLQPRKWRCSASFWKRNCPWPRKTASLRYYYTSIVLLFVIDCLGLLESIMSIVFDIVRGGRSTTTIDVGEKRQCECTLTASTPQTTDRTHNTHSRDYLRWFHFVTVQEKRTYIVVARTKVEPYELNI